MTNTLIIAEAGVNHNGNMDIAYQLVDAAKDARADVVKFQTFKPEKVVSRFAKKAIYQKNTTDTNESQLEMVKKLEFDENEHRELMAYCKQVGIKFLSTPFDLDSIKLLHRLGLSTFKIPSGEITNYPYLKAIAKYNKKIILSTGMANLCDIESALSVLTKYGTEYQNITILHCNTEYPTPFEDVNLRAMLTIRQAFELPVGYSDHTLGIEVPIAAVALGATIVEKHFTLDQSLPGPDHKASLEPEELKRMVSAIRNIEIALGSSSKKPSASERKNMSIARKSIIASRYIKKGDEFTDENITTKRPGDGISPMRWEEIIGTQAKQSFEPDEKIVA